MHVRSGFLANRIFTWFWVAVFAFFHLLTWIFWIFHLQETHYYYIYMYIYMSMSIPHCPHLSKHVLIHRMFDLKIQGRTFSGPMVMKGRFAQILRVSGRNYWKIDLPLGFQTPKLRRYDWTPKTYLKNRTSGGMTGRLMKTLEDECQ